MVHYSLGESRWDHTFTLPIFTSNINKKTLQAPTCPAPRFPRGRFHFVGTPLDSVRTVLDCLLDARGKPTGSAGAGWPAHLGFLRVAGKKNTWTGWPIHHGRFSGFAPEVGTKWDHPKLNSKTLSFRDASSKCAWFREPSSGTRGNTAGVRPVTPCFSSVVIHTGGF